jgi:hypothetical protein
MILQYYSADKTGGLNRYRGSDVLRPVCHAARDPIPITIAIPMDTVSMLTKLMAE